jgi:hypothetical protein
MLCVKPIVSILSSAVSVADLRSQYHARDPFVFFLLTQLDACVPPLPSPPSASAASAPVPAIRLLPEECHQLLTFYLWLALGTGSLHVLLCAARAVAAVNRAYPAACAAVPLLPPLRRLHEYTVKTLSQV